MSNYFKAMLANYIFFFANTILFLVITSLAIRVMGQEFYGLWTIINAVMLFSGIGTLGMGVVVNKFGSEAGENALGGDVILTTGFIILLPMAALCTFIILLVRGWMASHLDISLPLQNQFSQALVITSLTPFPQFISRVPIGYLHSQLKNHQTRLVEITTNALLWTGSIFIAIFARNLVWIALWGLIVQIFSLAALVSLIARMHIFHWNFQLNALRRMLGFSLYNFIENLAMAMFQQFDRIVVGFVLGPTAAGIYAVGTSVGLRLSMITGQATDVMLPYASRKDTLNERTGLYKIFRKLSQAISLLLASIGSLLILWMPEILSIWISPEYADAYSYVFRLVAFAYIPLSVSRLGHQTLIGTGHVRITSLMHLVSSIVMLAAVFILASKFGLIGAATANLFMAFLLTFNIIVYRKLSGLILWREILSDISLGLLLPGISLALVAWQISTPLRLLATFMVLGLTLALAFQNGLIRDQASQLIRQFSEATDFKKAPHR